MNHRASAMQESGKRVLVILAYHKIGPPVDGGWDTWFYVPQPVFEEHLRYLRNDGWTVIDLATFQRGLNDCTILPPRAALITFDDGYASTRRVALPVLVEYGHPAVIFVPTDFVGGSNAFDQEIEPEESLCDWDDLRALEDAGVSVESHAASHAPFSELEPDCLEHESRRSKWALESHLLKAVTAISYPYGDGGREPARTRHILRRAGYRTGFLYGGGIADPAQVDVFALPRVAMGPDSDLRELLK